MEILEHGTYYRIVTCHNCNCKFCFSEDETHTSEEIYSTYYIAYKYINCPECQTKIILNKREYRSMKTIRLAGINGNDMANGDGVCVSVWLQGCPHRCPGCHNPETWDFNGGTLYEQDMLIFQIIKLLRQQNINRNLSFLGGEPLCEENRDFVKALAAAVKYLYEDDITIYCWTGYKLEDIDPFYLSDIDVLIDGPFEADKRDITLKFRGSSNQRLLYKGKDF